MPGVGRTHARPRSTRGRTALRQRARPGCRSGHPELAMCEAPVDRRTTGTSIPHRASPGPTHPSWPAATRAPGNASSPLPEQIWTSPISPEFHLPQVSSTDPTSRRSRHFGPAPTAPARRGRGPHPAHAGTGRDPSPQGVGSPGRRADVPTRDGPAVRPGSPWCVRLGPRHASPRGRPRVTSPAWSANGQVRGFRRTQPRLRLRVVTTCCGRPRNAVAGQLHPESASLLAADRTLDRSRRCRSAAPFAF
ncbi:hypothetical protein ABIA38_003399 [Embleya sp. AB8]